MDQSGARRATIILGVVMIIAIGGSAILPLFTNNATTLPQPTLTPLPDPTLPPPLTDFSGITFDQDYLHPTGLFSIAQPNGWTPAGPITNPDGAEVSMNNPTQLSVVQASLQVPPTPITTLDELDAIYTSASLNDSWSNYRRDAQTGLNYRETARTRQDDKLVIDFELQNQRRQTFLARQVAWADGDWVYSVRVVTPVNAIDLLRYMIDNLVPTFQANKIFVGTSPDWTAYFDPVSRFAIRFPSIWTLDDSAPGRPASISGESIKLRVEALPGIIAADEAAARAWVEANRAGASVISVEPVTRGDASGFSVAYTYTDAEGAPGSGLVLLLNGENALYLANLRLAKPAVDLNGDEGAAAYPDLVKALETFQLLADLNLLTPTPAPTLPPTVEPTPEATVEPTADTTAEPEATPTP